MQTSINGTVFILIIRTPELFTSVDVYRQSSLYEGLVSTRDTTTKFVVIII